MKRNKLAMGILMLVSALVLLAGCEPGATSGDKNGDSSPNAKLDPSNRVFNHKRELKGWWNIVGNQNSDILEDALRISTERYSREVGQLAHRDNYIIAPENFDSTNLDIWLPLSYTKDSYLYVLRIDEINKGTTLFDTSSYQGFEFLSQKWVKNYSETYLEAWKDRKQKEGAGRGGREHSQGILDFEMDVFQLINLERVHRDLYPYKLNEHMRTMAGAHSDYMLTSSDYSHSPLPYAENIWRGYVGHDNADTAVNEWLASHEGHREILLSAKYLEVGIGVAMNESLIYTTFIAGFPNIHSYLK